MLTKTGVTIVAVHDAHHFSALWPNLGPWARKGFVGLGMVASGQMSVAAKGTTESVMSTNPIAFATPVAGADLLVFNFATSLISHGDLQLMICKDQTALPGTSIDAQGEETDSPSEILDVGNILPFSCHKGALIAMMIDMLVPD